jgi:hypothetical protein
MSFKFTWPKGMAERVLHRFKSWYTLYDNPNSGAKPVNPRKIIPPGQDEDLAFAYTERWKREIGFKLNELTWLQETLNEEDSTTSVAQAFTLALNNHLEYIRKHPDHTGEFYQWYDMSRDEVRYVFQLLSRIQMGLPTFAQEKSTKQDLKEGNW